MSKWKYVEGRIRCKNLEGMNQILNNQRFNEEPWEHYINPYCSLKGSEGDAKFSIHYEYENELDIEGSLRDAESIPEDKDLILKDFKKIIELTSGEGYIEIKYADEGTITIHHYDGEFEVKIITAPDGWDRFYERFYKRA